jgi:hypothetical protein
VPAGDRIGLPASDTRPSRFGLPAEVLSAWFAVHQVEGGIDETVLDRARSYAQSCGCQFAYNTSIREGIFFRQS